MTDAAPSKPQWRALLRSGRRALPAAVGAMEAVTLAAHARTLAHPGDVVCAYAPMAAEPGTVALLDGLLRAGARVLLPLAQPAAPLRWAVYVGPASLVRARYGVREPVGPGLDPETIAEAAIVLVPALAVDRFGTRLGRGGGHYDRSLPLADPSAQLVAVVRDEEVLELLPRESHDVLMGWALTPARGLQPLGH